VLITDRHVLDGPLSGSAPAGVEHVVVVDEEPGRAPGAAGAARRHGLATLLASAGDERPAADIREDELACIFFTSGTTGRSKGVMLTHGNLMFATRNALRMTGMFGPPGRMLGLMVMPLANTSGHQGLLLSISRATSVIVLDRFDPKRVLDLIERHGVNLFSGTPTMFRMLLDAGAAERDLSSIVSFGGGGDYFDLELVTRLRSLPRGADNPVLFPTGYGMTESAGQVTQCFPAIEHDGDLGTVVAGIEYRIVDEQGITMPEGEVGELWLRGPNVSPGYWRAPEATAAIFADGWLRTGDLVRQGKEPRRLTFAGRSKDVIVSGGNNIYPPEVERVLLEHPAIARAAVVGLPDPLMNQIAVAAVEPAPGKVIEEAELLSWITERVAPYRRPRAIVTLELPTSADLTTFGSSPRPESATSRCCGESSRPRVSTARPRWSSMRACGWTTSCWDRCSSSRSPGSGMRVAIDCARRSRAAGGSAPTASSSRRGPPGSSRGRRPRTHSPPRSLRWSRRRATRA
jgi:long-chain acyl-CoA synthetase